MISKLEIFYLTIFSNNVKNQTSSSNLQCHKQNSRKYSIKIENIEGFQSVKEMAWQEQRKASLLLQRSGLLSHYFALGILCYKKQIYYLYRQMISTFSVAPWDLRNIYFNLPLDIPTHLCTTVMKSKHVKILHKNVPSLEVLCWIIILPSPH